MLYVVPQVAPCTLCHCSVLAQPVHKIAAAKKIETNPKSDIFMRLKNEVIVENV
jgi:hypothetical protein